MCGCGGKSGMDERGPLKGVTDVDGVGKSLRVALVRLQRKHGHSRRERCVFDACEFVMLRLGYIGQRSFEDRPRLTEARRTCRI
ncbi:hypothetical protein A5N83_03130 [Rhodococcus sp. 1139]|nr:hypothetical protein A5N83_03130 [Rhodococcus sp. 1139]